MIELIRWIIALVTFVSSVSHGSENRQQVVHQDDIVLTADGYVSLTVWAGNARCRDGKIYLIEPRPKSPRVSLPNTRSTIYGWEVIIDHLPQKKETVVLGPYSKGTKVVFGFEFRDNCDTAFPQTADRVEMIKHSNTFFSLKIEDAYDYDRNDYYGEIRLDYTKNSISERITAVSAFNTPPHYSKPFCNGNTYKTTAEPGDPNHPGRAFDFGMKKGEPICASEKGVVLWREDNFGSGSSNLLLLSSVNVIVIQTENGVNQNYLHLEQGSIPKDLKIGDVVEKGQLIARAGNSGYVRPITGDGSHLHIEWVKNCYDLDKAREMRNRYKEGRATLAWSCPAFPAGAPLNFE